MTHYRFESEWSLTAPIEKVFDLVSSPEDFSDWWPSVKSSRLLDAGASDGVGRRAAYRLRSPLIYSMNFEARAIEVEKPSFVHTLVRGDLVGTGTYLLDTDGSATRVRFLWYVSTTKHWMNLLAPLAKPIFVWAHNHVMSEGAAGMARRLHCRLVSTHTRLINKESAVSI